MTDIYSTDVLIGVVEDLKLPGNSVLDTYFSRVQEDDREEIHFDLIDDKRRVAPFVHPNMPGKVVQTTGQKVATFKPAYVKDKRVLDPRQPLKRAAGEQIGGTLSAAQREQLHLAAQLEDMLKMLTRREEVMAVEALSTGKVVVVGDNYPSVTVDFGRDAALSPAALTSTARWGQSAADPLANLRVWSGTVQQKSGVRPRNVLMDPETVEAMLKNADVKARLDQRHVTNVAIAVDQSDGEGLAFIGTIDGYNIWAYSGWFVDPATGTEGTILPQGRVVLASPLVEGVRAYGAIIDPDAGYTATRYHVKSWTEKDPGRRLVMLQSAPLMVPTRVNATLGINVL